MAAQMKINKYDYIKIAGLLLVHTKYPTLVSSQELSHVGLKQYLEFGTQYFTQS
jgi:hypothetical protein